jgi:hypothetical protein
MFSRRNARASCPMSGRSTASMRSRHRCPRPASCASTPTATRWMPAPSAVPSRSPPMPNALSSGRTARSSESTRARSPRQDDLRSAALHPRAGSQAGRAQERRAVQRVGPATGAAARAAQARPHAERRPADGRHPRCRADRRARCRGGSLCRGHGRGRPFRRRHSQHPRPPPGACAAADHRDAGCVAADLRARRRLCSIRQPQETRPWKDRRCWTR